MDKKIRKIVTIVILLFVIAVTGIVVWKCTSVYYKKHPQTEVKEVVNTQNVYIEKDITISGETIEKGIQDIGKLNTAEYYFTHVETFDSTKSINDWPILGTNSSFIYSYDGKIFAGIDFEKIRIEKNDTIKEITITMPEAEIISSEIDPDSCVVYEEKNNVFNPIHVDDVTNSINDMIDNEVSKAIDNGILDRAEKNAQMLIENFVKSGYQIEKYKIKFAKDN